MRTNVPGVTVHTPALPSITPPGEDVTAREPLSAVCAPVSPVSVMNELAMKSTEGVKVTEMVLDAETSGKPCSIDLVVRIGTTVSSGFRPGCGFGI